MLVTVIVVTFNSSDTVVETLESIRAQTWSEIELVVSDDCSSDDTLDKCREWIRDHGSRFIRTGIITSPVNNGVSANCNRGMNRAKGEWIKYCAGDDCLMPDCILDNVTWVNEHPESRVVFSQVRVYKDEFKEENYLKTIPGNPFNPNGIMAPGRTAESQYRMLLVSDRIHFTPSVFLHKGTLKSVGGFDDQYSLFEDYPLWLKLTENGHRLWFMEKTTMKYRMHSKSLYNKENSSIINPNYYIRERFRRDYTYPRLPVDVRLNARYFWIIAQFFRSKHMNHDSAFNRLLLSLLTIYLNPMKYILHFRRMINKSLKDNEFYM